MQTRRSHLGGSAGRIVEIAREMRTTMPGDLYDHCTRTMETAAGIARAMDLDQEACAVGGLLHDYCRHLPGTELLRLAVQLGIVINDVERYRPVLLHGPVAAVLVSRKFGIADSGILNAIRYHTTGRAGMGPVEQAVYIADKVEPGRGLSVGLDVQALSSSACAGERKAGGEGVLRQFLLEHVNNTIVRLVETGKAIHPLAVEMRNWIIHSEG